MQQPFFKALGLDFDEYFGGDYVSGTLNLSIAPMTYDILKPEYFFKNVAWTDIFPAENFFMSAAHIHYQGQAYRALLYIPDPATKPDHFQAPSTIEAIAQTIPGIEYGHGLSLAYNPSAIALRDA